MKPTRYFVRVWTVDPEGEGPDTEHDTDIPESCGANARPRAILDAKKLRREGKTAAAFERTNIRLPEFIPGGIDPPAHLYDCEHVQIDEDEIDREIASQ